MHGTEILPPNHWNRVQGQVNLRSTPLTTKLLLKVEKDKGSNRRN